MATQLDGNQIKDGAINNAKIGAGANIETSKFADGANFIQRGGGVTFTADQPMGGFKITGLGTPTNTTDAATKAYVDALVQGLDPKASCRVATTANITLSGTQTIDGVAVIAGERILVKNQSLPQENGIYVVAAGSWARASDMDDWTEVPGAFSFIEEGTAGADKGFVCSSNAGGTLGTTAITWVLFTQTGTLPTFVDKATPTGAINGSNTSFSLAQTPTAGSEHLYRNGLLQESGVGNDYTISGATITMLSAPVTGDRLLVSYRY
jgi:hypothetical protein